MRWRSLWLGISLSVIVTFLISGEVWTQTTERVSVDSAGLGGNDDSYYSSISSDGHYVAFSSYATTQLLEILTARLTSSCTTQGRLAIILFTLKQKLKFKNQVKQKTRILVNSFSSITVIILSITLLEVFLLRAKGKRPCLKLTLESWKAILLE